MSEQFVLAAQPRDMAVKPKALRRQGGVPGTIYGPEMSAASVQTTATELERMLRTVGTSSVVSVTVEGWTEPLLAIVREVQRHPVTGRPTHVDLYRVLAGRAIRSEVPVVGHGLAPALREGALVTQLVEAIEVECLPENMPHALVADLTRLAGLHASITAADLAVPEGVTLLIEPDTDIFQVVLPRGMEEEEVKPAEAEAAAAAPVAAAPAAAAAPAPTKK
ncbi:MAG: 50S ribosomal protein L25 [Chloroflexota bacterium]